MRQQDFVDVASRLLSWQKGLFPTLPLSYYCRGLAVAIYV